LLVVFRKRDTGIQRTPPRTSGRGTVNGEETVQNLGVIRLLAETDAGPSARDDMVPLERAVHRGGSYKDRTR
jgi:hypothetical protein